MHFKQPMAGTNAPRSGRGRARQLGFMRAALLLRNRITFRSLAQPARARFEFATPVSLRFTGKIIPLSPQTASCEIRQRIGGLVHGGCKWIDRATRFGVFPKRNQRANVE